MIRFTRLLCTLALLAGCAKPAPEDSAFISPDGHAWVHAESVPADEAKDQLLPTTRLTLHERYSLTHRLLAEDLETLCGVHVIWLDPSTLGLRVPGARMGSVRFNDSERWGGILLRLQLHEDQVSYKRESPDHERWLIVVKTCETDDWNLYLRRTGEPTFNAKMQEGWDDPDLAGGFSEAQPVMALDWTGPRSAKVVVLGKRYQVTVREQVGDVKLKWVFDERSKAPKPNETTLQPLKMR